MRDLANDGKWEECLPLTKAILRENPDYPFAWMCLGWGSRFTGHFAEAIPAYERAYELGATQRGRIQYEIAICEANLGHKQQCLRAIKQALSDRYTNRASLRSDPAFEPFRSDPSFMKMAALTDAGKKDRNAKWTFDARYLVEEILRLHPNPYQLWKPSEWKDALAKFKADLPRLDDDQAIVRMKALVRQANDGHSSLAAPYEDSEASVAIPLLFGQFEDGVYVTAAEDELEPLLWSRVVSVNGTRVEEVMEAVGKVVPQDSPIRRLTNSPPWLRYPQLLHGLGLSKDREQVHFGLILRTGETKTVSLKVNPGAVKWIREPKDGSGQVPDSVHKRNTFYSADFLPSSSAVWIHYNGCQDMDEESIEAFAARLDAFIASHPVERLIFDVRWNGGGNNFLNWPLIDLVIRNPKLNEPGKVFVIAGQFTFSAALCFTGQMERFTKATIVGTPTSSPPNFVGETIPVELPCTGLLATISNTYWQNGPATDARIAIFPKVRVPWRFSDFRIGRDAALEAILGKGFAEGMVAIIKGG